MTPMRSYLVRFFVIILLLAGSSILKAQVEDPVSWSYKASRIEGNEYLITFSATIEQGWHLYSILLPKGGPQETKFSFNPSTAYTLKGKVYEIIKATVEHDNVFDLDLSLYTKEASFGQVIELKNPGLISIDGNISYQVCLSDRCIFLDKDFSIKVTDNKLVQSAKTEPAKVIDSPSKAGNKNNISLLMVFFLFSFLAGLVAILTPCVFPMIPMTVSFFMKTGSKGKIQAIVYGLSIIIIYALFGTIIAVLFGAEFSNWISTHWIPNVLFFLIFVLFAASFFGYFDIVMPNWLVNKSVSAEEKGGTIGTIFMALTLVLVSFSCTGPIVGTILVQSVGGQILRPIVGMLGFSLAFAIPFTLFALFPQWLNKMPKSGGWLNSVKVVLGFVELAFALKFLNVPDQTYHWGILDREIYLGFWIVIFAMMGFYLLGKIKFPHDNDYPVVKSFPRLLLIIATFAFVVYLMPGLWGAPLKGISGWLPPMETQDFDVTAIVRDNAGSDGNVNRGNIAETPKYSNTALKLPHGLKGYFDYYDALKASKVLNKPVFVDFTGHGCTNCREMENRVWSDPGVLKRLRDNFVIVALYVDDKVIEMPKEEWYINNSGKEVRLLGKKNTEIQIEKFGTNAQPYYAILDSEGNSLVTPKAYDLDIESYKAFLDNGVSNFNKKNNAK
jgi:thiol:disulfide interchange protein